jgi:tubulin polyglutamylase TTLL6/13
VVKRGARKMDMKVTEDENSDWDIYWSDINVQPDRISKLRPYQRINAIPNISVLARKNNLASNLMRMSHVHKEDYSYFPKTWLLPQDAENLNS